MAENEPNPSPPDSELRRPRTKAARATLTDGTVTPSADRSDRPETVIPPNWAPTMLVYADISRMLFRMHRNVAAHMDAHKRLAGRMQAVFAHEQAMVLELARLIDESMALAQRQSNEDKTPLGGDSVGRIFDHASNAMKETGQMLTDIQLESLALLQHYITGAGDDGVAPPEAETKTKTETGKE